MDDSCDLLVIGGGPAGLSAAVNGVIRGCTVLVLDTGASMLARAEKVDNYLGLPGITGIDMMTAFSAHALGLGVKIERGKASGVMPMGGSFMVSYGNQVVTAKAIVLATGVVRDKAIQGEEEYLGKGVSYCATCDGMLYRGKKAVVYGLASDAPEEANYLADIGVQVVYINPGQRPDALKTEIEWHSGDLSSIRGNGTVSAVVCKEPSLPEIEAQGVFLLRSAVAPGALLSSLQMEGGYIAVDKDQKTNIPGVFACGDCTGAPLQIANAVGDGLIAGQEAAKYIGGL